VLRCETYFRSREHLVEIFLNIDKEKDLMQQLKDKVNDIEYELEESDDEDFLYDLGN